MTQIPTWSGQPRPSGGPSTPGHHDSGGRTAPGTLIGGRYALRAAIGHGGMGTVWRAADTLLRRDVAVKEVVSPAGLAPSDRDAMYERTLREARAAAALSHPAVVQVYDVVTENGRPWIVMELLDARSLADMVIEDGPLAPRAVAKIGVALLGALEVAHAAGVLHRDVKPANVLIAADGRCVLTDFGVARMPTDVQLTTPGMVLGSPHFISPERALGGPFGPPSDLFSLGVTLFTAVEGRPPFDKGDPIETMHSVVEDPPAPLVRAGALGNVLYGLLEKDPHRRFDVTTARALLRQLLAGALASQAPPHLMTDPYAVVPAQRAPKPPPPPQPTGQIGGRAMIGPGQSLTDRLARLKAGGDQPGNGFDQPGGRTDQSGGQGGVGRLNGGPASTGQLAGLAANGDGAETTAVVRPGTHPAGPPGTHAAGQPGTHAAGQPGTHAAGPPGTYPAGRLAAHSAGSAAGGRRRAAEPAPMDQTNPHPTVQPWDRPTGVTATRQVSSGRPAEAIRGAVGAARAGGDRLVATVRGWSRNRQLAAAAGVGVVLLLGVVALTTAGDDQSPPARPPVAEGPAPEQPTFPVQRFADRGVALNVPDGWRRADATRYVDFTDPDNSGRRVRILLEEATAAPERFMRIAEGGLKRAATCAKPYNRLDLRETELGGQPAAELEYTCGAGDTMRHGIWRAIVTDGQAHSFYLTAPEDSFAESKIIFEEMVRSFELRASG